MQTIFMTGTQGMDDQRCLDLLQKHHVDAVIDIRLHNEGRWYRFASGKHIKALVEARGIAYRHDTRFSPTWEMLDRFRGEHDWPVYEQAYQALIQERDMARIWQEVTGQFERPCLLCAEKTAEQCHRRLLAEHLASAGIGTAIHIRCGRSLGFRPPCRRQGMEQATCRSPI